MQAGRAAVPHPAAAQHPAHQTAARPAPGGGAGGWAGEGGGQEEQGGAQGRLQVAGLGLQAPVLPRLLAEEIPGGGEGAHEVTSNQATMPSPHYTTAVTQDMRRVENYRVIQ